MRFYVLTSPRDTDGPAVTDFSKAEPVHRGDAPKCISCGGFIGSLPWLPPHRPELEVWGREYGDIAFVAGGGELLVSQRVAGLYRAEGLTGLDGFDEVEVAKVIRRGGSRLRTPPPKYYYVSVARSRAAIDQEASGFVHERPVMCSECREGFIKRWSRIVLEAGTWSGEDLFLPRGLTGTIMASERFREFFERHAINNGVLIKAEEYAHDFYPWESTSGTEPKS